MRSLILYYTYHGNTQRIAERIHAAIGGDIARVRHRRALHRRL